MFHRFCREWLAKVAPENPAPKTPEEWLRILRAVDSAHRELAVAEMEEAFRYTREVYHLLSANERLSLSGT